MAPFTEFGKNVKKIGTDPTIGLKVPRPGIYEHERGACSELELRFASYDPKVAIMNKRLLDDIGRTLA